MVELILIELFASKDKKLNTFNELWNVYQENYKRTLTRKVLWGKGFCVLNAERRVRRISKKPLNKKF